MLSSISHSIKQAYKVLTLCAFHYEFYITDRGGITRRKLNLSTEFCSLNRLTPNDPYMGRTAPLTSKRCILYIYSTNIGTENFKYALYSPFFSLQNAVGFIMLTCLVPVLFTFYIQGVLILKKIIPAPKGYFDEICKRNTQQLLLCFPPLRSFFFPVFSYHNIHMCYFLTGVS